MLTYTSTVFIENADVNVMNWLSIYWHWGYGITRSTCSWKTVDNRSGHSRLSSHYQSAQCTHPSHRLRQQWRHNPIQLRDVTIATQRMLMRARVNGTEIVLKSTDRSSKLSLFRYVQMLMHGCLIVFISRVIRWNCFSKMWRISLPRILQNSDLQCKLKTAGGITNDGFLEWILLYNALCIMHAGEPCTANHVIKCTIKHQL